LSQYSFKVFEINFRRFEQYPSSLSVNNINKYTVKNIKTYFSALRFENIIQRKA